MREENLEEIRIDAEYIFDKVFYGTLSFDEVCKLYEKEKQIFFVNGLNRI